MKLISWNVRCLGRVEKRRHIKLLLKTKGADMVFFQESKQSDISIMFVKSLWPGDDIDFKVVDSDGAARGLLCIWKTSVINLTQCCYTRNCIFLSGTLLPDFDCVVVNIYAPNDVSKREKF